MPARNGSGPMGLGPGTGQGMGYCDINRLGLWRIQGRGWFGIARGRRGGFGWGFLRPVYAGESQASDLKSYRRYLEKELNYVNQLLNQDQ